MKLNKSLQQARWAFFLLIILSQLTVSCTGSKKAKMTSNKDVPKSYSVTGKGLTNLEVRMSYIDRYKAIAVREMERTGIPASIKLAQGILESDAGRSTLSSQYNNHFGVKCHSDWQGERYYQEDDDKDPLTGQLIKSCFRAYKSGDESFIAHSEFLRDPRKVNRYGALFQLDPKDYAGWANGLERSGYATANDYSEKLIRIIEDLQLHQYDLASSNDISNGNVAPKPSNPTGNNAFPDDNVTGTQGSQGGQMTREGNLNDVKFVRTYGGMTVEQIAGRYDISVKKLQSYNEEIGESDRRLKEGSTVYLQSKRNYWHGTEKFHRVQSCETMYDIAQKYGISLTKLYSRNKMREGDQAAVGERVALRKGWFQRVDMPALRDTFNEWKKCEPEATVIPTTKPTTGQPNVTTTNPRPSNGEFGFDITPSGTNTNTNTTRPASSYPTTSNPNPNPTYPSTETSSYPSSTSSYPSTTTSYPSNSSNYPNTTSSYPSTTSSYPSTTSSYPSTTTTTYPSTRPATRPATTTAPPSRPATTVKPQPTKPTQPSAAVGEFYVVQQGETLWAISRKLSTTVDKLKALNNLTDNIIKPGQQLRVK
jgi:flagellum-specific peptidoglycan hydrolase FlgJ/LysM repeat protein